MTKTTYLTLPIIAATILSCGNNNVHKKNLSANSTACNKNYDTALVRYANSFKAEEINLNKNISVVFLDFINKVDTNCLRQQRNYNYFISVILAKLYLQHLVCCNQGYDLLSMKKGGAGVIINEFERMAGYQNKNLEMLNSGTIVDFVEQNEYLKAETDLKALILNIKKEQNRIEQKSTK